MTTLDRIRTVLCTILDPEMPISIVDLGLIEDIRITPGAGPADGVAVVIDVLPTFVGCPALDMIRNEIVTTVSALNGVSAVDVEFINDPPWNVDRITEHGRVELAGHGVTVPALDGGTTSCLGDSGSATAPDTVPLRTSAVACPFCGSSSTRLDSPFGPTRCRMIYYCEACRNGFEHMKRLSPAPDAVVPPGRP